MDVLHSGSNIVTVRENNLSLVIRLIHQAKICSRADLAKLTGLKQATITNIVNDLLEWELVCETGYIPGTSNRRSIGITLNSEKYRTIGVRLNRNYVVAGIFDIAGSLIERRDYRFKFHPEPEEAMEVMFRFIKELHSQINGKEVLGIGVAIPGPFVTKNGKIALMSGFPGWESVEIKQELEQQFSIPVFLEHDANCGALSEMWYGDIGDFKNVVFIAADVGVGAGVLINKRLYSGNLGIAGEIGHMSIDYGGPKCECGNRGCLELYCSTATLMQEYKKESLRNPKVMEQGEITVEGILKAVEVDNTARQVFTRVAQFLGLGIVSVVNAFDPELIIISDRLALAGDYLLTVIKRILRERLLPQVYQGLSIRLGSFAQDSMLFGASALVLENILKQPTVYFKPH